MSTTAQLANEALRKIFFGLSQTDETLETLEKKACATFDAKLEGKFDRIKHQGLFEHPESLVGFATEIFKTAVVIGYQVNQEVGWKRLDLDKEIANNAASFFIPSNKETRDRTYEAKIFLDFLALFEPNKTDSVEVKAKKNKLKKLLGLKSRSVDDASIDKCGIEYTVIPGFLMNFTEKGRPKDVPSEDVCRSISLFLEKWVPTSFDKITEEFKNRYRIFDMVRASITERDRFLQNIQIERVIMVLLLNLLWCLQHPVDPETNTALSAKEKSELCSQAKSIIGRLLSRETAPDIHSIGNRSLFLKFFKGDKPRLVRFVRCIERYLEQLTDAFIKEDTQALGMELVASKAQKTSQDLGENLFDFIYKGKQSSSLLAFYVDQLNQCLANDKSITSLFEHDEPYQEVENLKAKTIVDIIIIFLHLSQSEKKQIIHKLVDSKNYHRSDFGHNLKLLNNEYIRPLEKICQDGIYNDLVKGDLKTEVVNRFLPMMSLALTDQRINVDTEESLFNKKLANTHNKTFHLGIEQLGMISRVAYQNDKCVPSRYHWDLTLYLKLGRDVMEIINKLPQRQYKLGQYTILLDNIYVFISNYKTFLLYPKFKKFLIRTLSLVNDEFSSLRDVFAELDKKVIAETNEDREIVNKIQTMDDDTIGIINSCRSDINKFNEKLTSAEFEDSLKENLLSKLKELQRNFCDSFGHEQEDMVAILTEVEPSLSMGGPFANGASSQSTNYDIDEVYCNYQEVNGLTRMLSDCLANLSWRSSCGPKGQLFRQLVSELTTKKSLKKEELLPIFLEVSRIVCAYQKNAYFFHADYADTKTAKIFIGYLTRSLNNKNFPMAKILFGQKALDRASHYQSATTWCRSELNRLQKSKSWAIDATDLGPLKVNPIKNFR